MTRSRSTPFLDVLDNPKGSIVIDDFSGGLNTIDSNEILNDNESIIKKNWENSSRGAISKVNGFTKANSTTMGAKPVRGLFRVYQSASASHLLAVCNGKLYYSNDDGATFTQATGGTGLTETSFCSGVNYNDLFFFTNKSDNLKKYTPGTTTMAATTSQPTDPCGVLFKRADRRLVALNNDTNGSTLYFSKVDPTGAAADDWSASNDAGSIAVDGAKSEKLISGAPFGSVDIIFKEYAAFRVWGYPNPQATRLPGSPGCAAPYSVAVGDGLMFHLSHDAVWMYDGNRFIKISDPIEDLIDNINSSYIQNAFGVYRNGYYWLFYTESGDTTNQNCLIYDVDMSNPYVGKNVWFERTGLSMNCPVVLDGVGDENELFAGASADTGFAYRLDYSATGDDAGANIEAVNQTKYFNDGQPNIVKRFSRIYIKYYSAKGTINVTWYTNMGNVSNNFDIAVSQTGTALGSFTLGTSRLAGNVEAVHVERLPDTAIGTDISLKITHEDTGVSPIIREIEIKYESLYQE